MEIGNMSYNQLLWNLKSGNIDMDEIREAYQNSRKAANAAIKRIDESDVPFTRLEKPSFPTLNELGDNRELLKALADVNNFRNSPYGTLKGRHELRDKFLDEINRGRDKPLVTKENYSSWGNYMEWFRANKLDQIFGSKDDVVEDFFSDSWEEMNETQPEEWEELFNDYIEGYL